MADRPILTSVHAHHWWDANINHIIEPHWCYSVLRLLWNTWQCESLSLWMNCVCVCVCVCLYVLVHVVSLPVCLPTSNMPTSAFRSFIIALQFCYSYSSKQLLIFHRLVFTFCLSSWSITLLFHILDLLWGTCSFPAFVNKMFGLFKYFVHYFF